MLERKKLEEGKGGVGTGKEAWKKGRMFKMTFGGYGAQYWK